MSKLVWEYHIEVEEKFTNYYMDDDKLNALGLEGWELVNVTPETEDYNACFYFKRLLNGASPNAKGLPAR